MMKIGLIGISAAILATLIRKERPEMALMVALLTVCVLFSYVLTQMGVIFDLLKEMKELRIMEESYYLQLMKMLGIAYAAEFASSLCQDAGFRSIGLMMEVFARVSLVALGIPGILILLETLEVFL